MNDFYLELALRKSACKTDEDGNYLFEVEASNENLDFQNQRVLQRALWDSRDNFLKYGVISNDHLHHSESTDGGKVSSPDEIIGEPVDVRMEDGKTIVVGKLYHSNPTAQAFIRLLKDGSTRVRSSIGGIFPKVRKLPDGSEAVTSVLWNDLALTSTPVNNTVGYARLVKSYTPDQFVKALQAGYETDNAQKTGGEALISENMENAGRPLNVLNESAGVDKACAITDEDPLQKACELVCSKPFSVELLLTGGVDLEELRGIAQRIKEAKEARGVTYTMLPTLTERLALAELVDNLGSGAIASDEEALRFLIASGIANDKAQGYLREIENTGGCLMKKSIGTRLSRIVKAFKKGGNDTQEELDLAADEGENIPASTDDTLDDEDTIDLDDEELDLDDENDEELDLDDEDFEDDEEDFGKSRRKRKSLDFDNNDDELVDGTEVMKSIARRIARLEKSLNQVGRTVATVGEAVAGIGNQRNARIAKSYAASVSYGGYKVPADKPTQADYEKVQNVLQKSVSAGEISLIDSSKINSEFQRAMRGERLSAKTYAFLSDKIKG